jgi:cytochrome c oxidase subunit 4
MSKASKKMGESAPSIGSIVRRPALILLLLLVVLAGNTGLAFLSLGGWQFTGNILLAAASVVLIGFVFMELDRESALSRLFAAAGFAWLVIFAMLTFADYMTRI